MILLSTIELAKRKLLKLRDYTKVVKYRVNIQKSVAFLYANNEQLEFEFKNIVPFILAPPKVKYSDINIIKYA